MMTFIYLVQYKGLLSFWFEIVGGEELTYYSEY